MCGGRGDAVDGREGLPVYMAVCLPLYICDARLSANNIMYYEFVIQQILNVYYLHCAICFLCVKWRSVVPLFVAGFCQLRLFTSAWLCSIYMFLTFVTY